MRSSGIHIKYKNIYKRLYIVLLITCKINISSSIIQRERWQNETERSRLQLPEEKQTKLSFARKLQSRRRGLQLRGSEPWKTNKTVHWPGQWKVQVAVWCPQIVLPTQTSCKNDTC